MRAVADTHAVIWYLFDDARLSLGARTLFEDAAAARETIAISSITLAEIVYLVEKGRIPSMTFERLSAALDAGASGLVEAAFDRHIADALRRVDRQQVPDLPDRIIAATALRLGVPLISRDRKIQLADIPTIW